MSKENYKRSKAPKWATIFYDHQALAGSKAHYDQVDYTCVAHVQKENKL